MAQYHGQPVIPVDIICRDYFSHLTPRKFIGKLETGDIALPMVRIEESQKSAKGIYLTDLAEYLDKRRDLAMRDFRKLSI